MNWGITFEEKESCKPGPITEHKATQILVEAIEMWLFEQEFKVMKVIAVKDEKGSFADAFIAALGARSGCSRTLTFSLKAARLPGFELA